MPKEVTKAKHNDPQYETLNNIKDDVFKDEEAGKKKVSGEERSFKIKGNINNQLMHKLI